MVVSRICTVVVGGGCVLVSTLDGFDNSSLSLGRRKVSSLVRVVNGGLDKALILEAIDFVSTFGLALFVFFLLEDATVANVTDGGGGGWFDVPVV